MDRTLIDALSNLQFVGRTPSWQEYEASSPADRRAIVNRWNEIVNAPRNHAFENDPRSFARSNRDRAFQLLILSATDRQPQDDVSGDYAKPNGWQHNYEVGE